MTCINDACFQDMSTKNNPVSLPKSLSQDFPLLTTKLSAPVFRSKIVQRTRLVERLRAGMRRKLSLVSAPAGYGKTTLLREWLTVTESLGWPVAWVSLDKEDNRQLQFWAYVLGALQTIEPDLHHDLLSGIGQPCDVVDCRLLTPLINQIAAIPHQFSLVLDDYHEVQSPLIHQTLAYLIEYMPPNMHLVIASRTIPHHFPGSLSVSETVGGNPFYRFVFYPGGNRIFPPHSHGFKRVY